ncbi:MAG: enoyl-CoA hydratase-related protein [Polynucleobacter sp.]|uniref:enoyl-CoA hydratase-related protein n=1 Tax=Polynucleobacter sp. TaxID=2029855 RepID=UPI00272670FA|nr:enoyl-CoA hydratase-related protein [Polynucleobacter sp.]MDO8713484.1 enoyl-CoA hydratase-related protein [Polynucleobacter sp.]
MAPVLLERPSEHIALIRLNRPEAKNALNSELRALLSQYFLELNDELAIRCIVITGSAEVFAAGADLKEIVDSNSIEMMQRRVLYFWKTIAGCAKPIIAAVNGVALGGGCELALNADIIVAGESANFGQTEVNVGVMPGGGATQRLVRAIGKYRAMKMLLTGEIIRAPEALAMGFVSEVVPDAEVLNSAMRIAERIAQMPPLAIMQIKEVVLAGADVSLDTGLMLERKAFELLFSSKDQKEGMNSFIEKRKPHFTGQ